MKEQVVRMSGGLGNQLFQLAASHFLNSDRSIGLLALGDERRTPGGEPDINLFRLAHDVSIKVPPNSNRLRIVRKLLRDYHSDSLNAKKQTTFGKEFGKFIPSLASRIALSPEIGLTSQIRVSTEIGFDPTVTDSDHKTLWMGFFQSYKYAKLDDIRRLIGGPSLREPCKWLESMADRAALERPLVVHLRLGDYKDIPNVGIPTRDYYHDAISSALQRHNTDRIWVFSDELQFANQYLSQEYSGVSVVAVKPPSTCDSPAASLLAMALGQSFVIGNSTFSYWAARLSGVPGSKIFAPDPWFMNGTSIRHLMPPDWTRVQRR